MKNQKGFTLIELLIVILLIGVLSGVLLNVINVQGLRKKTRDSQRIADIKKIQTALELYFADERSYPTSAMSSWANVSSIGAVLVPNYISALPQDPNNSIDGSFYSYASNGNVYVVKAIMEVETSHEGNECGSTSLNSWGILGLSEPSSTEVDYCYGVQNPL